MAKSYTFDPTKKFYNTVDVVEILRAGIARNFPNVKASVRKDRYGDIEVTTKTFPKSWDVYQDFTRYIDGFHHRQIDGTDNDVYCTSWIHPDTLKVTQAKRENAPCIGGFDYPNPGGCIEIHLHGRYISWMNRSDVAKTLA